MQNYQQHIKKLIKNYVPQLETKHIILFSYQKMPTKVSISSKQYTYATYDRIQEMQRLNRQMAKNLTEPRVILEYGPPKHIPAMYVANDQTKVDKMDADNEWLIRRIQWAYQEPSQLQNYRTQQPPQILAQNYTAANERIDNINRVNSLINDNIINVKSVYDRQKMAEDYSFNQTISGIHQNVARTYATMRRNQMMSPQKKNSKSKDQIIWNPDGQEQYYRHRKNSDPIIDFE